MKCTMSTVFASGEPAAAVVDGGRIARQVAGEAEDAAAADLHVFPEGHYLTAIGIERIGIGADHDHLAGGIACRQEIVHAIGVLVIAELDATVLCIQGLSRRV